MPQQYFNLNYTGAEVNANLGKAAKLPTITSGDAGKAITVNENGNFVASTVDGTPTASSTNLITSGGVKAALDALKVPYVTEAPTEAVTGGLKFAVLTSAPATKYNGWIYLIVEE